MREDWVDGEVFSLQTPRYKVIHNPGGAAEYYDLEVDPLELEDLAAVAVEPYSDLHGKLEGLHGELLARLAAKSLKSLHSAAQARKGEAPGSSTIPRA